MDIMCADYAIPSPSPPPPLTDADRYRQALVAFDAARPQRAGISHAVIAMEAAAKEFGTTIGALQATTRGSRRPARNVVRQKVMAFAVYCTRKRKGNNQLSWTAVGRAMHRTRSTVIHSWDKFGDEVVAALGE